MAVRSKTIEDNTLEYNEEYGIRKGQEVYYARCLTNCGVYDVLDLKIRTITDSYFVGTEKTTRQAFLFGYSNLERIVFKNRKDAVAYAKQAEKTGKKVSSERCYEEF